MPSPSLSSLDAAVDAWTLQVVTAQRVLVRLYRSLGDEHQAAAALRVAGPALERMERLRLQGGLAERVAAFLQEHPDDTDAEECAWRQIIAGLAGTLAFFALVDGAPGPGLRGPRQAAAKAFALALQSYRKAFPDEWVEAGTAQAVQGAIRDCGAVLLDLPLEDPAHRDALRVELEAVIQSALAPFLPSGTA